MHPCQQCVDLKAEHERLKAKFAELHKQLNARWTPVDMQEKTIPYCMVDADGRVTYF